MLASKQTISAFPTGDDTPTTAAIIDAETAARLRAVIGRLHRRLRTTPAAAAAGLTPTKISVLFTVTRRGPIGLSELAAAESVNPTMLSRIVGHLTDAGLVRRGADPADRRAALVTATAAGDALADRIRRERTEALNEALTPLSAEHHKQLEQALPALEALAEGLQR
jgi:DNA-binding MarR family transcriptional regulator